VENSPWGEPLGFALHSLIPLEDFKAILGIDDREDSLDFASLRNQGTLSQPPSLAAFCLTIATYSIEQYCMRRLLLKRHIERIEFHGDLVLRLREY
jgi:dsRNA-specific ribonuclease